jgi:hypothetical protein
VFVSKPWQAFSRVGNDHFFDGLGNLQVYSEKRSSASIDKNFDLSLQAPPQK